MRIIRVGVSYTITGFTDLDEEDYLELFTDEGIDKEAAEDAAYELVNQEGLDGFHFSESDFDIFKPILVIEEDE